MKDAQADSGPGVAGQLLAELESSLSRLSLLRMPSLDVIRARESQLFDAVTPRPTESGARLIHLGIQLERARAIALELEDSPALSSAPLESVAEDSEEHELPDEDSDEVVAEAVLVEAGAVEAVLVEAGAVEAGAVEAGAVEAGAVEAVLVEAGAVEAVLVEAVAVEAVAAEPVIEAVVTEPVVEAAVAEPVVAKPAPSAPLPLSANESAVTINSEMDDPSDEEALDEDASDEDTEDKLLARKQASAADVAPVVKPGLSAVAQRAFDDEVPEPDELLTAEDLLSPDELPDLSGLLEQIPSQARAAAAEPSPPVVAAPAVAVSAPAVAVSAPAVAVSAPAVAVSAPAVAVSAPAVAVAAAVSAPAVKAPVAALGVVPLPAAAPVDDEATMLMSAADIRNAMARGPVVGADLAPDEAVPGSDGPLAQVGLGDLRELDEGDLLLEDDERLDEPVQDSVRSTPAAETSAPRAALFDSKGHAMLPTIRETRDVRPAAAAIQLTPDGQGRAVGIGLDYFDEVKVALPPADDEDGYDLADEGNGLSIESHGADDYEEEEEEEEDSGALNISEGEDEEDEPVDISNADIGMLDEIDPAQVRELTTKAQRALDQGDLALAATFYSDLLDLSPNSIEAFLGRGRCYLDLGDFAAAMSDFQKAEDLDPNGPEPLVAMGELFAARKDYGRAIEFFDHAIALSPKHAMARCRRGICHYYKKSYRPAWLDLSDAERLDPNIPNIKQYVGMAKKKLEGGGSAR